MIRVNTALTHYTLEWLQRVAVGRVVFASSSENYAATTDLYEAPIPTPETVPLTIGDMKHPRWTYAVTKMLGESAFLHSAPAAGFEATCTALEILDISSHYFGSGRCRWPS